MQKRINRENRDPKAQKGITPLSLLEQKKLRKERQKQTKEKYNG
tara:strand:+ start:730 stop:861 length:132 start_codon:yes stop_codon:yes gene_type:complete